MTMDQSTLVSNPGDGVGAGAPTNPNPGRDAGADDLDARLQSRIQETANGFRSMVDKRFSSLDPIVRQVPQLQNQMNAIAQQLQTINGYFQAARDAELPEEERNRQQALRAQNSASERERALMHNAHQQHAIAKVVIGLQDLGFKWGDSRIDWNGAQAQFEQDPASWTSTIILNANRIRQEEEAARQTERQSAVRQTQDTRAQELAAQARVDAQNTQRAAAAAMVTSTQPSGETADWTERVKQMDHEQRLAWIRKVQNGVVHGEVTHPNQVR